MTQQQLQQELQETTDFSQRQSIFKQLWKLRHQQPIAQESGSDDRAQSATPRSDRSRQVVASTAAERIAP